MNEHVYIISAIAIMTATTFLTRAVPFFLLGGRDHPLSLYLGRYLPPAVMTLLVIYSLRTLPRMPSAEIAAALLAVALTAALHLWRRNALLSIGVGTGVFMVLMQTDFFGLL